MGLDPKLEVIMNVLTLCNDKICYNSLNYFRLSIENAFRTLGHTVYYASTYPELIEYSKKCDFYFGFNCLLNVETDGVNTFDLLGIPIVDFLVDNPYMHHIQLTHPRNEALYVVCLDENHKILLDEYYPMVKASVTGYVLTETDKNLENITKERDVLFLATYTNEVEMLEKLQYRQPWLKKVALDSVEFLLSNPATTVEDAIAISLGESKESLEDSDYCNILYAIGNNIDFFLRGYFRHLLAETITAGGIKLHVSGNGWEKLKCTHPENLIINPPCDFSKSPYMLASSKIVLNVNPWFKRGLHDRIISTMLNKSISVTDSNPVIDRLFKDGEDILTYSLDNMQLAVDKIKTVLSDESLTEKISENAYEKAKKLFSWEDVAKKIIDMIEENEV